ncbi:hypothetical protein HPB47_020893, partial [Ixodes persulcatus]
MMEVERKRRLAAVVLALTIEDEEDLTGLALVVVVAAGEGRPAEKGAATSRYTLPGIGPAGARTARKGPLDSGYEPGFDGNVTRASRSRSECGFAGGFESSRRAFLATVGHWLGSGVDGVHWLPEATPGRGGSHNAVSPGLERSEDGSRIGARGSRTLGIARGLGIRSHVFVATSIVADEGAPVGLRFTMEMQCAIQFSKGGERVRWEYHNVSLARVPGYGFGIAVSGGRDNPHFVNGEPSIAISDVLRAGPAEGKLQINDRVISANGLPLENVDYATAVQVLRECGNSVNLVIRRRVVLPSSGLEPQTLRVTLTKAKKKDDYGIVLGCRIYVKEVSNKSVAEKDGGVQEGDVVLKINGSPAEGLTLKEARKLLEGSKERLQLVLRREGRSSGTQSGTDQTARWSSGHQFDANHKDASPNFVDVTGARPHWSNQNLYVQPPTRGDYRPPPPPERADEKNNLSRGQAGRNRGPLLDISLSQLDQPVGQPPSRDADGTPPRPPPPRVNEYGSRRDKFDEDPLARRGKAPACDPRYVSFQKEGGSVGIRLTGGNRVGIFVTAVQPGSPASLQGLQAGDKILKVNNLDTRGMTREEAVLLLLNLQDQVHLVAQYCRDEYDEIVASQKGDSFYIRTHFSYESGGKGELSFHVGEVFRVVDTLHNGTVGSWLVFRLGRNHQEIQKGVIPNRTRAEELSQAQQSQAKKEASAESSRGSFFKRRSARRAKALCKDHWEDVLCDGLSKFPAYERVTLKHPGFIRPVVLFGPMADVARDKLLRDYPDKYASP